MTWVKRWVVMMALGGMLLVGPTGCVVAPVEPGYVVSPPVGGHPLLPSPSVLL